MNEHIAEDYTIMNVKSEVTKDLGEVLNNIINEVNGLPAYQAIHLLNGVKSFIRQPLPVNKEIVNIGDDRGQLVMPASI